MKNHILIMREVDRNIFDDVVSGKKTIETRAATPKYRNIGKGDTLTFTCGKDSYTRVVREAIHFDSLEAMFNQLSMEEILPNVQSFQEAQKVYFSFPGYKGKLERYGVIAFVLENISDSLATKIRY